MRRKGFWYVPGRLYDLAFVGIFRGLRRRVAAAVERDGLYPWLDVCCGTGSQFRGNGDTYPRYMSPFRLPSFDVEAPLPFKPNGKMFLYFPRQQLVK